MHEVDVIEEAGAAATALDPIRTRLLAALAEPASAATLAERVGLTRQKVNYHLRTLEAHGLVHEVRTRRWGGLNERMLVASAASYVVSPGAFGAAAADPSRSTDRLSARYLIALAARVVREVGGLVRRADTEQKRVATLSIDTELRFASPAERTAFAEELAKRVSELVARYHDESAPPARAYRLVVGAHPIPTDVGADRA
ncbi:winged helix-turn-helix domain-containing protein [Sciscionella marina]|uniref:winged helix-turn-helix domain-containing protein n=1 Tax=Sciscionella marina TaxID=508770 RepID=UPI00037F31DD|nr:helix-turn-helix domain-containing protein [Sciscionella marina]